MRLPIYQVDAFTSRLFSGNPAAIVPLERWLPDELMQAIAAENNLSETAFVVPGQGAWGLRWMTPTVEVPLCGHATLAAAYVLMELGSERLDRVDFDTRSGRLSVTRGDGLLWLDFPSLPPADMVDDPPLVEALGAPPQAVHAIPRPGGTKAYRLAVYATEAEIAALDPDLRALRALDTNVVCTAPGAVVDFVSRFFAPASGVDEDPVTGSAHCTLTPYWAAKLGKTALSARQISRRGGSLSTRLHGDRVTIGGTAALYLHGEIVLPEQKLAWAAHPRGIA